MTALCLENAFIAAGMVALLWVSAADPREPITDPMRETLTNVAVGLTMILTVTIGAVCWMGRR